MLDNMRNWNLSSDHMKRRSFNTLKAWRASWGLTQSEAARLLGISQSKYNKTERCSQRPKAPLGKRIADKTGVPFEVVMQVQ